MNESITFGAATAVTANLITAGNTPAALDATQFLAELKAKRISALEYVQSCFDRIERFDGMVKAFKQVGRDMALQRARKIDERVARGESIGAMAGVPVGVKDVFNTYDFATGMGSSILDSYQPGNDARIVSDIRLEGGIIAGKTVTAEFAVHSPGPTRNPHDLQRTPGTSSSGSAAAVASFMVPVALGTQTAGSIIRPASYCGVIGYKPSFGLIPRTAMLKTTDTLDTVGYLARSVTDVELLLETTRVRGHNYPVSEAALADPGRQPPVGRRWRVAVLRGPKSDVEAPSVKLGVERLANAMAAAGCEVFEYRLPPDFDQAHEVHEAIYQRSLSYYFRHEWKDHADMFSPRLQAMIEGGLRVSAEQYQQALARQSALRQQFDQLAAVDFDILLCPSTADEAPIGLDAEDPVDHCLIWTMVGAPSISLPLLTGRTGRPAGCQFVARRYADYCLLNFARFVEQILPGFPA